MKSFNDLPLRETTQRALRKMGFESPTAIQAESIPLALQGEDLIAQAQTGTGKTAAFGIPLVEAVEGRGIQALVLCPTRELATQVTDELNAVGAESSFKAVAVFGGVGMGNQVSALKAKSTTCVVACPGRLLDHLARNPDLLGGVTTVVLDEADRMLDMGFLPDVERILKHLPQKRQTLLFSATMPPEVRKLADRHLKHPETVRTGEDSLATPLARQTRVTVSREHKLPTLLTLLKGEGTPRTIVFTRTKHGARRLAKRIDKAGISATSLHGDLSQNQRTRALEAFRSGEATLLVATDVAARGLDVPDVTHVVNFDVPVEEEAYVHRVGRTGRNGQAGRAYLFVEPDQRDELRAIEKLIGEPIEEETIEVPAQVLEEATARVKAARANAGPRGPGRGKGRGRGGGRGPQKPAAQNVRAGGRGGNGGNGGGRGRSRRPSRS